jgi:hypothetical protein
MLQAPARELERARPPRLRVRLHPVRLKPRNPAIVATEKINWYSINLHKSQTTYSINLHDKGSVTFRIFWGDYDVIVHDVSPSQFKVVCGNSIPDTDFEIIASHCRPDEVKQMLGKYIDYRTSFTSIKQDQIHVLVGISTKEIEDHPPPSTSSEATRKSDTFTSMMTILYETRDTDSTMKADFALVHAGIGNDDEAWRVPIHSTVAFARSEVLRGSMTNKREKTYRLTDDITRPAVERVVKYMYFDDMDDAQVIKPDDDVRSTLALAHELGLEAFVRYIVRNIIIDDVHVARTLLEWPVVVQGATQELTKLRDDAVTVVRTKLTSSELIDTLRLASLARESMKRTYESDDGHLHSGKKARME